MAACPLWMPPSEAEVHRFNHLSVKDGLPHNTVFDILQDGYGFIWFGTEDGLVRFDGIEMLIYRRQPGKKGSLPGNSVFQVYEDRRRRLWVCTSQGLARYDRENDLFVEFPFVNREMNDTVLFGQYIRSIYESPHDGRLFVCSTSIMDICEIDTVQKKLFKADFPIQKGSLFDLIDDPDDILIDNQQRFWIAVNSTIWIYRPDIGVVHLIHLLPEDCDIRNLVSHRGAIWAATSKGLFRIDEQNLNITRFSFKDKSHFIPADDIWMIDDDPSGNLWVCTDGGGLLKYLPNKHSFLQIAEYTGDQHSLRSNKTRSVYVDRQGILWVGLLNDGVNYMIPSDWFDVVDYSSLKRWNIPLLCANIVCHLVDLDGDLWLGLDCGGVIKVGKNGIVQFHDDAPTPQRIGGNKILTLAMDQNGKIWAAGYFSGINIIDPQRETVERIIHPDLKKPFTTHNFDDVRHIYCRNDGTVWLATCGGGINYYDPKTGLFKYLRINYNQPHLSISSDYCLFINEDNNRRLYFGSYYGLTIYDQQAGTFQNTYALNDTSGLCNNWVYTILRDQVGDMWLGTFSGLNRFDPKSNRWHRFDDIPQLSGVTINGLLQDEQGYLWITTNTSLIKWDVIKKQVVAVFSLQNGLPYSQFIHGSGDRLSDGRLGFCTTEGLVIFDPLKLQPVRQVLGVYIIGLKINNKDITPKHGGVLDRQMMYVRDIRLSHRDAKSLSIKYTGINFVFPSTNEFRYRLSKFDDDWVYAGNRREVTYTNLPAGHYLFEVQAKNKDNRWHDDGTLLYIEISPAWWNTWWFRGTITLLIFGGVLLVFRLRLRILKYKARRLKELVDEKTAQLKDTNDKLVERNIEIVSYNHTITQQSLEIKQQVRQLALQKEKIEAAYQELDLYKQQLEVKVDERTRELFVAKEKAEEADRLKTAFLKNISHEIRTPLNAIVGFSKLMTLGSDDPDERIYYSDVIDTNADDLLTLIEDIVDLSKYSVDALTVDIQPLKISVLNELLTPIMQTMYERHLKQQTRSPQLIFHYNEQCIDTVILADANRLLHVFVHLMQNALKFTTEGTIEVGCIPDDQMVFYVRDSGKGIEQAHLTDIFNPFNKLEPENNNDLFRGTGIGLPLCKALVSLMGGRIWVESKIHYGSIFYFSIPLNS